MQLAHKLNDIVQLWCETVAGPATHDSLAQGVVRAGSTVPSGDGRGSGESGPLETPAFFSLRTTVAALLALASASASGMDHPWWAAMTVWLVAQPTRGLLFERALARLAGSALGAIAGAAILLGLEGRPIPSLSVLALWLMLCAGLGSRFRHFRNYGFVLAGYTAAIIVLFGLGDGIHDGRLAMDRVACTMLGVVCSALPSIHGIPAGRSERLSGRVDALLQRCLDRVEQHLRCGNSSLAAQALVADVAALERSADNDAAGSLRGRRNALRVRRISGLLLELIALTPAEGDRRNVSTTRGGSAEERIAALSGLCRRLIDSRLARARSCLVPLASVLGELSAALRQPVAERPDKALRGLDLRSALRAGARPVTALALASALWWISGWQAGAMMAMTATLFVSLFSAHDRGNEALIHVLAGSLLGALAGVLTRLLLLPRAADLWAVLLCIAPFLLLGAWLMRRRATEKMAIDMNMTFLLTAQPGTRQVEAVTAMSQSAAIIAGVLVAVATYGVFLPSTPRGHRRRLVRRIALAAAAVIEAPTAPAAANAHRALRAAHTRLLDFCDPGGRLFVLSQGCLLRSRRLLVRRIDPDPSSAASIANAGEDLRRASAELSACIDSLPTADRNTR